MISYTLWSEAGGVGKTSLAVNLAAAHSRHGQRTLLFDLDPQNGGASHHLGVDDNRNDPDIDNIVRHLIDRPKGDFGDLIQTASHGIDVVPSHNMLETLGDNLDRAQQMEQDMGGRFVKELQLRRVITDNNLHEEYDVIIVDPPATGGQHLYNAVAATTNVAIPLELTPKGEQSLQGLEDTVNGLEEEVGVEVGVVAVIPNKVRRTRIRDKFERGLEDLDYPVTSVQIPIREAMLTGAWDEQTTAYEFVEAHDRAQREWETLQQFDEIARFIAKQFNIDLTEDDLVEGREVEA